jgi:hypothetical protein
MIKVVTNWMGGYSEPVQKENVREATILAESRSLRSNVISVDIHLPNGAVQVLKGGRFSTVSVPAFTAPKQEWDSKVTIYRTDGRVETETLMYQGNGLDLLDEVTKRPDCMRAILTYHEDMTETEKPGRGGRGW